MNIEETKEILKKHTISNAEKKTVSGIIYTLHNLYAEMLHDERRCDLLRLGVVKMSAEVFERLMADMPDDIMLDKYLDDICNCGKDAYSLVNRQKAEINMLNTEKELYEAALDIIATQRDNSDKEIEELQAEIEDCEHKAIREFARKVFDKFAEVHGFPLEEEAQNIIDAVLEEWE